LFPLAGAQTAIANLRMMSAARAHDSGDRLRLQTEACAAYAKSLEVQRLIPVSVTFSSSGSPIPQLMAAVNVTSVCSAIPAQTHQ